MLRVGPLQCSVYDSEYIGMQPIGLFRKGKRAKGHLLDQFQSEIWPKTFTGLVSSKSRGPRASCNIVLGDFCVRYQKFAGSTGPWNYLRTRELDVGRRHGQRMHNS